MQNTVVHTDSITGAQHYGTRSWSRLASQHTQPHTAVPELLADMSALEGHGARLAYTDLATKAVVLPLSMATISSQPCTSRCDAPS